MLSNLREAAVLDSNPDTTPRKGIFGSLFRRGSLIRKKSKRVSRLLGTTPVPKVRSLTCRVLTRSFANSRFRRCIEAQAEQVRAMRRLAETAGDHIPARDRPPRPTPTPTPTPTHGGLHDDRIRRHSRIRHLTRTGRRNQRHQGRGRVEGSSLSRSTATGRPHRRR